MDKHKLVKNFLQQGGVDGVVNPKKSQNSEENSTHETMSCSKKLLTSMQDPVLQK